MRTVTSLFPQLCDSDRLDRAAELTVRGKRRRREIAWFLFRREEVLERLRSELLEGIWEPGGFELVWIRDPKPRVIARAPIEDRVIHTALVKLMEPVFVPSLMPGDFACRPGFGAHRAVIRLRELMRRHRYVVHLDVRAFFPSVDLDIQRRLIARTIRDDRLLAVLDRVFDVGARHYAREDVRRFAGLCQGWPPPGRGLPIGASTSQFLATHVYLNGLDHFVKRELKVPGYVRYVDDFFLFGERRVDVRGWRAAVGGWLAEERNLLLKHPRARVLSCHGHLDALGYRVTRRGWEALPRALRRFRRRVAAEATGRGGPGRRPDIRRSAASTAGVVLF
jgi:RNA-directed DNA polymerase